MWRTVNSLQFWTRTTIAFVCVAFLVFWAKYAVVYNIPQGVERGHLYGVRAYVAEKTWWFGPLAFDLGQTAVRSSSGMVTVDPATGLIQGLGAYQTILEEPRIVWVSRATAGS